MSWVDLLDDLLGDRLSADVPMGILTTYRVGGPARRMITIEDERDLAECAAAVSRTDAPTVVVGKGSNLLIADAGFDGLAVRLGRQFTDVTTDGTIMRAGGAASLPVAARRSAAAGLTGFEWAVGVPGAIGGAVRMNAGGHGSDIAATLQRVRVVDLTTGEDGWMGTDRLELGYRSSQLRPGQIVVEAQFALEVGDADAARAEISEIVRWRRTHQPGGQNAGSVFTNPEGDSAGRLIDSAGGRGLRLGSAEVSPKHANFIQSDDGGSADDVVALMARVRDLVRRTHGVELHPETRLIGFSEDRLVEVGAWQR